MTDDLWVAVVLHSDSDMPRNIVGPFDDPNKARVYGMVYRQDETVRVLKLESPPAGSGYSDAEWTGPGLA